MRNSIVCLCLFSALASAQSFSGSIRGTITDSSKAAVPGAKVTVIDQDRNVEYPTQADSSGRYIFPTLPAARYVLTVEAAGFRKSSQPAFRLEVQQQSTIDIEMAVGELTTTVEVQASASLINTTSATLGQVVENRVIQSVPNNGRNPLSLVLLAPGITGSTGGVGFISNGVRNNSAEVMLDGGILTGIEQNGGITEVKYAPTSDVVEELKVQTNYFSAEFGNTGGTIINMVSKSGTNEVHGVGYYYRRDAALNANNWFANSRNTPLADSYRNWFGGTIGGPVYLPKLYNGKNKTFFFADFDRYKQLSATTSTGSVPTARQLAGDFSDTRLASGALVPLFDPYSTFVDAAGNTLRNPIPGNLILPARQNPIALAFNKYFPAPTSEGNAFTRANNWFAAGSTPSADNKIDAKIDHNVSEKQRFSTRYSVDWGWSGVANLTGNISHNGNPGYSRFQNFIIDYTRTHSPTTVFTARVGVLRAKSVRDPLSVGFDATTLGLPPVIHAAGVFAFPQYSAQYRSMGAGGFAVIHRYEDVYQASASATKILSSHTMKAGAEYRLMHENYFQPNLPNGGFTFSRNTTAQNPLVASSTQGDGLASALLGWGSAGTLSVDYPTAQSAGYFATYFNDDWRITRRLTLNIGLRYDFDIPRTDRFNRMNWLDLSAAPPVISDVPALKALYPNMKGLMRFADDNHRSPYDGDWNNVQPRLGVAYALNSKTSLRAAYGIFYTASRHTIKGEIGTAFGFTDSSVPWSLDNGRTQYATFANPFPVGITLPPGRDPVAFLGRGAGTPLPKDLNPQYQQWNFSIQRQVPGQGVVEVNYSASKGSHLYFGDSSDAVSSLTKLDPSYYKLGRNALSAQVPNPFYGIITNPQATSYNQPTIAFNRLLRPYVGYTGAGGYRAPQNIADSNYHSLQLKYEKRFSRGLSVIAHYTISKMISDSDEAGSDVEGFGGTGSIQNLFDFRQERSLAVFDVPQRLVVSFDYQIPIGRGRAFGKGMNRLLDGLIGGWELSSIISASSRTPLQVTLASGNLMDSAAQRPNLVGDPSVSGSVRDKLNNYFNLAAFTTPATDIYGSAPRTLSTYRGPSVVNEDATLMKNFAITEKKRIQVRLEAYSVTNSPQWGNPNTSFGGSTFGQITTAGGARTLQVAAKFYY